jgi:hypothetical protein
VPCGSKRSVPSALPDGHKSATRSSCDTESPMPFSSPDGGRNIANPVARTDVFFKCSEMTQTFWSVWKRSQTGKDTVLSVIHDGISVDSRTTTFAGALPDDSFAPLAALHMAECGGPRSFRWCEEQCLRHRSADGLWDGACVSWSPSTLRARPGACFSRSRAVSQTPV